MSDENPKKPTYEELRKSQDEAEWAWLKPHVLRDGVVLVNPGLDLVEVALRIAADEKEIVQGWIKNKQIGKPSFEQLGEWDRHPARRFLVLVVQPYVLAQELVVH